MIDITKFAELVQRDHGLALIALALPDGTVHASVDSAGILSHPVAGIPVIGVVAGGQARKLTHPRTYPPRHRRAARRLGMDRGGGPGQRQSDRQ
jgi:hypothetical protein